ncbi:MAG: glycosyltransferase, partial [Chthoniobacterales bacterium]|nr:glycosyltransferase [Chthoniobacterales bacterium]
YAGRLVPYKGLWLVLKAIGQSPLLRKCKLRLAGDGPEMSKLQKLAAELGISSALQWLGQVSQDELSLEMRKAQCFVFASLREFGGAVVLEAMACGLPCIVVNYGGPAELVDPDCGILLPLVGEEKLAPALRKSMERMVKTPELCVRFAANTAKKRFVLNLPGRKKQIKLYRFMKRFLTK